MSWWWCLKHSRAERDPDVDVAASRRSGPYETEEAARDWREQFAERNEQWDEWDEEDRRGPREGAGRTPRSARSTGASRWAARGLASTPCCWCPSAARKARTT